MSRGLQVFRQTDITKAIRAAQNAGLVVQRFEVDRAGKIVVLAGGAAAREAPLEPPGDGPNEWDAVRGDGGCHQGVTATKPHMAGRSTTLAAPESRRGACMTILV